MDPAPETQNLSWLKRAAATLPTGASTGSKRPDALYGGAPPYGPTHFLRATGCTLETAEGETLVDCTMALGSVALGYADPQVSAAVAGAAELGNVAGLSHVLEVEVAELLCEVIPCAEKVQLLKTGAESVAAAVRMARTFTGRDGIVASGYFGWHDWCSADTNGVPAEAARDVHTVPFNDILALEQAVSETPELAAVVIEPVVEQEPDSAWLRKARELCDARGAVLVFDEIKTGFRFATGGYQQVCGVLPDLATFGKAMANGFPLAAVCGRRDVMDAARNTWISSTLASEATALAAARAVLERHHREDVCGILAKIGAEMKKGVADRIDGVPANSVEVAGSDQMWFFRFADEHVEASFLRAAVDEGVLFKRGAYNFPALAHSDIAIKKIAASAAVALERCLQAETKSS